jgi:hypothetical protein
MKFSSLHLGNLIIFRTTPDMTGTLKILLFLFLLFLFLLGKKRIKRKTPKGEKLQAQQIPQLLPIRGLELV